MWSNSKIKTLVINNLWTVALEMQHIHYLPLVCSSSKDAIYSVDDGELDLLSFELVVYVL